MKFVLTVLVAGLLALPSAAARAETPNEVIESAIEELAAALDGRRAALADDRPALYELIDGILLPRFDRQDAARLVLARHWRTADEEQRRRFIDAFYNSMLRRYADGVLEFQEDRIEVLNFRGDLSRSRVQAKTIVRLDDGSRVPVDYGFVNRDGEWKLFDVTVEGVSFVRNFRAELDVEIRETSLDAVISRLETESEQMADAAAAETVAGDE